MSCSFVTPPDADLGLIVVEPKATIGPVHRCEQAETLVVMQRAHGLAGALRERAHLETFCMASLI